MNLNELEQIGRSFIPCDYHNFFASILYTRLQYELYFVKEEKNYKVYCPDCDEYRTYSASKFKQIRCSRICPECNHEFEKVVDYEKCSRHKFIDYVFLDRLYPSANRVKDNKFKYEFIYETRIDWAFGQYLDENKGIHIYGSTKLIGITCTNLINGKYKKAWIRDIIACGLSYYQCLKPQFNQTGQWRSTKSLLYYNLPLDLDRILKKFNNGREAISKRRYLEHNASFLKKSNQIYIAKHNLLNKAQLQCLKVFDCKSAALLYRYRGYISKNSSCLDMLSYNGTTFNEATLNYLVRNKVALTEYCDYCDMCKRLNIKPSKPKDLQKHIVALRRRIHAIESEKEKEERKALDPFIQLHSKELEKYTYKNDGYEVHPLRNLEECEKQSDLFTNCLYLRYTKPYAEKRCELYVVENDGTPVIDIEVTNGHLVQARGKMNEQAKGDVKKFISNWANNIRKVTT